MWDPRYQAIPFNMTWTILARVRDYNMTTGMHKLCLMEKNFIMFQRWLNSFFWALKQQKYEGFPILLLRHKRGLSGRTPSVVRDAFK